MRRLLLSILFLLISVLAVSELSAQQPPFFDEIQAFKKLDSISFPPKNAILFVGSSSFRKWEDVQSYFPAYKIINRGFGGSTLPDVIRYSKEIITPYHPKQVLIYCGDNDLASSDTITPERVAIRFEILFRIIRTNLPKTNIAYVSIKPSPSRKQLMPKMEAANGLIKAFLKSKSNTSFIDIYHPMLLQDGKPMPEIFLEDSLHMNAKGYAIWKKVILKHLIKK